MGSEIKTSAVTAGGTGKSGSGPALYRQVAATLREEIVNGVYPVGSLLPTEGELCRRFSVSRYTVREALRRLRADGLVSSRQGAGTVVIPPQSGSSDIQQVMSINDLVAVVSGTRFAIDGLSMVTVDDKIAARTGLAAGEAWLNVHGYRRSEESEAPVCRAEYFINRNFAAVGRLLQRHQGPIFPLIEDMFGVVIAEVQQQISATLLAGEPATALGVKEGSAALEVRRAYKTAEGEVVQVTINTHPASLFQHSMTMRRVKT